MAFSFPSLGLQLCAGKKNAISEIYFEHNNHYYVEDESCIYGIGFSSRIIFIYEKEMRL